MDTGWFLGEQTIFIGPCVYIYRVCKFCFGSFFFFKCFTYFCPASDKTAGIVLCSFILFLNFFCPFLFHTFQIWHFGLQKHFIIMIEHVFDLNLLVSNQTEGRDYCCVLFFIDLRRTRRLRRAKKKKQCLENGLRLCQVTSVISLLYDLVHFLGRCV